MPEALFGVGNCHEWLRESVMNKSFHINDR